MALKSTEGPGEEDQDAGTAEITRTEEDGGSTEVSDRPVTQRGTILIC